MEFWLKTPLKFQLFEADIWFQRIWREPNYFKHIGNQIGQSESQLIDLFIRILIQKVLRIKFYHTIKLWNPGTTSTSIGRFESVDNVTFGIQN